MDISKEIETSQMHSEGKCDFDFLDSKQIISCGSDYMLYLSSNGERIGQQEIEFDRPAIACHPCNRKVFVIGGSNQKVERYEEIAMMSPYLIFALSNAVHQLIYSQDGKYLAISSEENVLTIYNQDLSLNSKCRPSHDGMTLSAAFDPKERFVASIGCDGSANIFQLAQQPKLIKKLKFTKDVSPEANQPLICEWHPTGDFLALPGKTTLQIIKTLDEPEELESVYQIEHSSDISFVRWITPNILITAALDCTIKLWHFKHITDITLIWNAKLPSLIQQLRVNPDKTAVYALSNSGHLHKLKLELSAFNSNQSVPKKSQMEIETEEKQRKEEEEYQKAYSSKENAFQSLLQKKIQKKVDPVELDDNAFQPEEENVEQQMEEPEVKKKKKSAFELISDMNPQDVVQPASTSNFRGRKFLLWNYVGSVIQSGEEQESVIEVQFEDKNFYKQFKIKNSNNYSLAALNYRGLVLASKGQSDANDNEYQKEDENLDLISRVYFQSFLDDDFMIQLPEGEGAEAVAIGNDWFAVISDQNNIRHDIEGIEITQFSILRPFVCMCAYEQLLFVVFHDSIPMFGCQILKGRLFDIECNSLIEEVDVTVSVGSTLVWMGFSEDGLLITQDKLGVTRAYLFEQKRWVQISNEKFWICSSKDYELTGVKLGKDEAEPLPNASKPVLSTIPFAISTAVFDEQFRDSCSKIALIEFQIAHEKYRTNMFYHLNISRKQVDDVLIKYSSSIWTEDRIKKESKEIMKEKMKIFQLLSSNFGTQKILEFFKTFIDNENLMNLAISKIEPYKDQSKEFRKLYERMKALQQEKLYKMSSERNGKVKQQIQIIKISESNNEQQKPNGKNYGLGGNQFYKRPQPQLEVPYTTEQKLKDMKIIEEIENRIENQTSKSPNSKVQFANDFKNSLKSPNRKGSQDQSKLKSPNPKGNVPPSPNKKLDFHKYEHFNDKIGSQNPFVNQSPNGKRSFELFAPKPPPQQEQNKKKSLPFQKFGTSNLNLEKKKT